MNSVFNSDVIMGICALFILLILFSVLAGHLIFGGIIKRKPVYCLDCRHCDPCLDGFRCRNPKLNRPDKVTKKVKMICVYCDQCREDDSWCGDKGQWYESKKMKALRRY